MQILPPYFVLNYLIERPEIEFKTHIDIVRVTHHNPKHSKEYVLELLKALQGTERKTEIDDTLDLTVMLTSPRRIEFVFEQRLSKWVDGSDYEYYVLVAINELDKEEMKK